MWHIMSHLPSSHKNGTEEKSDNKGQPPKDILMRIINPSNDTTPFYVGNCKGNVAPKHVSAEGVETRKVKIDKQPAQAFNSPKTDYIYIKMGENWLWVKDKSIFELSSLTTTKIVREKKAEEKPAEEVPATEVTEG